MTCHGLRLTLEDAKQAYGFAEHIVKFVEEKLKPV